MEALIVATASGFLLAALLALFHIETQKGKRVVLPHTRAFLDRAIVRTSVRLRRLQMHIGAGSMRVTFHYLVQKFLAWLEYCSERFGSYLRRLQHRNRRIARSVKREQEKTHLDLALEHKEANTLTEKERMNLKKRAIEGEAY